MNTRLIPRYPEDDIQQEERERWAHLAHDVATRLYELYEPQDAHWLLTTAIIRADRDYRTRQK